MDEILKINLIEKYKNDQEIRENFSSFKNKIKGFNDSNKEFNLKTGDTISFMGGFNRDIEYISEILGFDEDSDAYILWDCYWFPLNLKERLVK